MLYLCCYEPAATTAKLHCKNTTVASAYSVGYCSSSYCSHFTNASFYIGCMRSGVSLLPSLKVVHTAYSVPTMHSFDSCMHFIVTLVPIQNSSKEQQQIQILRFWSILAISSVHAHPMHALQNHFVGVQYSYVVVNSLEQYFVSKWSASWESPDDLRPAIMLLQVV